MMVFMYSGNLRTQYHDFIFIECNKEKRTNTANLIFIYTRVTQKYNDRKYHDNIM